MTAAGCVIPPARRADLLTEQVGDELLVYDPAALMIHCLNRTAATLWQLCDGSTSLAGIVGRLQTLDHALAQPDLVVLTVRRLAHRRLLASRLVPELPPAQALRAAGRGSTEPRIVSAPLASVVHAETFGPAAAPGERCGLAQPPCAPGSACRLESALTGTCLPKPPRTLRHAREGQSTVNRLQER